MTLTAAAPLRDYDPTRDSRHKQARAAREMADWLAWLELGGTAPRTLYDYEWVVARLLRYYPSKTLGEFSDSEIAHVLASFPQASRRERAQAIKSFIKWGLRTRRLERNPFDLLPEIKRRPQKVIDVFSDAEVEALLALDLVDAAPLAVLFEAGLRKGEARRLQLRHCQPESGQIAVIAGKGGKDRLVPMSNRLQVLLSDLILLEGLNPSDHIFYAVRANEYARKLLREKPIGEGTFARWWRACLDRAGTRYRTPHTARHTFATSWRKRGLSIDEIQILLGHASIATTSDLYVHTKVMDVAEHMALIEAGL